MEPCQFGCRWLLRNNRDSGLRRLYLKLGELEDSSRHSLSLNHRTRLGGDHRSHLDRRLLHLPDEYQRRWREWDARVHQTARGGSWNTTVNLFDQGTTNEGLNVRATGTGPTLDLLYAQGTSPPALIKFGRLS